jgi:hypothetical protein
MSGQKQRSPPKELERVQRALQLWRPSPYLELL